jgi:hypothetical protein
MAEVQGARVSEGAGGARPGGGRKDVRLGRRGGARQPAYTAGRRACRVLNHAEQAAPAASVLARCSCWGPARRIEHRGQKGAENPAR